ncbi:MAG: metallophosphatase family protein [Bacteroidales bacterium]|nr:metallophosphatase family protein [Candidatus Colicola equi]
MLTELQSLKLDGTQLMSPDNTLLLIQACYGGDVIAAKEAADRAEATLKELKHAIEDLPDGQAVSVKVAEHTVALSKLDSLIGGETRVDFNLDDYVIDFRIVTTNLVWYKEEGAGALIPVSEYKGKVVTIVNNNSNLGRFSPLKDNKASNQTPPSFCDGFDFLTDSPIEIGETKSITIPQDCNYLYIYKSYHGADRAPEAVYTTKAGGGRVTVLESEMAQAKNDIASNAEKIDGVVGEGIFSTLPKLEFLPKMQAAKKRYYSSTNTTQKLPIVLAHISDIHGNFANVSRFLQFCDEYASYIDMKVNTGDLVLANWADDTSGYFEKEGANSIVNIIGNHDTRDEASTNWRKYVGVQAYNRYIAPAISSWGVTQPEGAAANGLCYYYKDYADNLLRIIFVDVMGYDDAQNTWLQGILADANTNGLHVMIVAHLTSFSTSAEAENAPFIKVDCNYSTKGGLLSSSTTSNNYNANAYKMLASVDAFMTAGGTFIGYLQGHAHYDFIARISKYPSQMVYAIGATKAGEMRDYNHIVGTRNQDEFQIVSIDTYLHKVVLYKVGANTDLYGREKNAVCIDYTTGNVIADH